MELSHKIQAVEQTISLEGRAIRTNFWLIAIVFIVCLIQAITTHIFVAHDWARLTSTAGGAVVTLLNSIIQWKDVPSKRIRIEALSRLKSEYESLQNKGGAVDEQRIAETEKSVSDFFAKLKSF